MSALPDRAHTWVRPYDMNSLALTVLLAVFGLLLLALACQRLIHARYVSASGHIIGGFFLLIAAGLTFVISLNLESYAAVPPSASVAELSFKKTGNQSYRVMLMNLITGEQQVFTLNGDDWQLDARILQWQDWANSLGLNTQFRLERLSARYREAPKNLPNGANVYVLSGNPGFDVWQWATVRPKKPSFVEPVYGTADFLPMVDGTRYRVTIDRTGVAARQVGEATK